MLVLNREEGETLWVGPVEIRIIRIARGQARIAINCPNGHEILRGELVSTTPANHEKFDVLVPRYQPDEATAGLITTAKQQG